MKKVLSITLTMALIASMMFVMPMNVAAYTNYTASDSNWYYSYSDNPTSGKLMTYNAYKGPTTKTDFTASDFPPVSGSLFAAAAQTFLAANETDCGGGTYAVEALASFDYSTTPSSSKTSTKLTSIELPYGIKAIGSLCFRSQNLLQKVYLPDSITTMAGSVFTSDSALKTIVLSKNLTSITATSSFQNIYTKTKTDCASLYFRSETAPTLSGSMMWGQQFLNVYYPSTCTDAQINAYKNLAWFNNDATYALRDANITFAPYDVDTGLPADAQTYYSTIGSGNSGVTPSPAPSVEPSPVPSVEPSPSPSPVPSPIPSPVPSPSPSVAPSPIPSFEHSITLHSSDVAGIVDPATGIINGNGTITGQPTGLIGGSTLNGTLGTAEIYIPADGTLIATGSGPCYGTPAVKFGNNGSLKTTGAAVTYKPTEGSLDGVDTTVYYRGEATNGQYSAEISALVTYDGGKTATVVCYPQGACAGIGSGTLLTPAPIGTYKDIESVKVYISSGDSYAFINSVDFYYNGTPTPPVPDGITALNLLDSGSAATDVLANAATVGSVKITSSTATAGTLIIAFYKTADGKTYLTGAAKQDISTANFTAGVANINLGLTIPTGTTSVKAMYWDSLTSIKPIFDCISK